jgi:DNA mismatch repair protein MutS2
LIYPSNFELKIGFDRIREMVRSLCLGTAGVQKADEMSFMTTLDPLSEALDQVTELQTVLSEISHFPLDYYFDLRPVFLRLRIEGTHIEIPELIQLRDSLDTIKAIIQLIRKLDKERFPRLQELSAPVKLHPFVYDSISSILSPKGEIRDKASPELANIRHELQQKQSQANVRIHQILKQAQGAGIVEKDVALAVRNGRLVIPVNASMKRRLGGFVHDESATGKTVFVEPAEIVELNNDILELEYAEKREILRILRKFTDNLRPYFEDLGQAYAFFGTIDFLRAKALFAGQLNAIRPVLKPEPMLRWETAVHPLLFLNFRKEGKKVVPLDIELNEKSRLLVISGPNAGGKSVCLQAVGLLQYMLQCGLLVPMKENSLAGLFENLFIEMGDDQSIENDLSTYSSHLLHMKNILKHAETGSLVLIDEFGSGTEPQLGGAIAEAILAHLAAAGCMGVITTHYTNLKHFAASAEGVVNGAMLFDTQLIQPLFRLEIGKPGSSFAFEIARKIGLPEKILTTASDKVGKDHVEFDRHLKDIARDRRYIEKKRDQIRREGKDLEKILERYRSELEETEKNRQTILEKARQEAREVLDNANRQVENTIRVIRETQAEKEATRKARGQLDELRVAASGQDQPRSRRLQDKIESIERLEKKLKGSSPSQQQAKPKAAAKVKKGLAAGDKVKMVGQDVIGEVISVSGKSILVSFGQMITTLDEKKLVLVIGDEAMTTISGTSTGSSYGVDLMERKLVFKSEIDVRGFRGEEALRKVMEFIDEAIMVNATEVRILHGKGDGILRQLIREYLRTVDVIKSFKDEHVERGGAGITVVTMEN